MAPRQKLLRYYLYRPFQYLISKSGVRSCDEKKKKKSRVGIHGEYLGSGIELSQQATSPENIRFIHIVHLKSVSVNNNVPYSTSSNSPLI